MSIRRSGESRNPFVPWVPACAGMTDKPHRRYTKLILVPETLQLFLDLFGLFNCPPQGLGYGIHANFGTARLQ